MSYNPNYPGGYPPSYGQPAYPATYPNLAAGYPGGTVYQPTTNRTDVVISENRCGETISITERTMPAAPPVYVPPPAPVTSTTVVVEERNNGTGFAAGVAAGMAAEAIIDNITDRHHHHHHHHHRHHRHHW